MNELNTNFLKKSFKTLTTLFMGFAIYYFAARLGLEVATINKQASPVWPATGIAMSLIFLFGPKMAIGIFVGAFLSNFETGLYWSAALTIALGNCLEALFFVLAFNRMTPIQSRYGIHSKAIFGILALVVATSISATIGTTALWITSTISTKLIINSWITWWIGDLLGALFILPIALKIKLFGFNCFKVRIVQLPKLLILFLATIFLGQFIFSFEPGKPFLFLLFLSILLAGRWFDSAWVYLTSLAICIYSVWQTIEGQGPFAEVLLNESLVHLQIFLGGLGLTAVGIGSLKQEGLHFKPTMALLFGWVLAGMTFYFSYTSAASKDETRFLTKVNQTKEAIEARMLDYVRALESGVSFFNASEHVSQDEWHRFANQLLSTNQYPGIEGVGVIFSSSIRKRFQNETHHILSYQPVKPWHDVPNLALSRQVIKPDDNFIVTYVEPLSKNHLAIGLNVSSEKNRYEAAINARDSGKPSVTNEVQLVQNQISENGFLIYVPLYKSRALTDTVERRRKAHIGFIYAPVIFEKFIESATLSTANEIVFKAFTKYHLRKSESLYTSIGWSEGPAGTVSKVSLVGKSLEFFWKRGKEFESSVSFVSSWIGFFGTLFSLFLAILLSSLQNLSIRAQQIADEMTQEVNERRRMWQALTETSPVGIFLTDKIGNCTYVNPTWCRMTGLTPEAATNKGWHKALHIEDLSIVNSKWQDLLNGKTFTCNYRFVKPDGTVTHVTGQAISLKDENNLVSGYFGTVQDITELHRNQMALLTSSRMSSLGEMASGMAHEINNPLAIIQGRALYLEKIIDKDFDITKVKISIKQMTSTIQRIAKIVQGLRSYARETSSDTFEKALVKNTLENTFELCRERFFHHEIKLITHEEIKADLCFWGRTEQISQVLLNLLNNSFDITTGLQNRWVKIEVSHDINIIKISVIDSGPGIEPGIQSKIFDPFFTTKEIGKGTGLGLSISKGIVERHNGQLYLDTSKVQTTFVVELPRLQPIETVMP